MRTTWIVALLAALFANMAAALSPAPPLEITLFVGTSGCPARPSVLQNIAQNRPIIIKLGSCAVAPNSGTLTFTSSDANATLPPPFFYNFLTMQPGQIVAGTLYLRTPGVQTLTVRDAANNIILSETFNVLPASALLEVNCVSIAIALPPLLTITGQAHPLSVINCGDTTSPLLSLDSTDPAATLPAGTRAYPPSLGVPEPIGSVTFQTPGVRVVRLRAADGTLFASFAFNVLPAQPSGASQPVPVNAPFALGIAALFIAALGVATQRRRSRGLWLYK